MIDGSIFIVGMRGVGKTTVGRLLSHYLQKDFFDIDEKIAQRLNKNIHHIIEKEGWDYFRQKEREILRETLHQKKNAVISTGGGILMFCDNADRIRKSGKVILLIASPKILRQRLKQDKNIRPPLQSKNVLHEIDKLWQQRKDTYYAYADFVIDTDAKKPREIVKEICGQFSCIKNSQN